MNGDKLIKIRLLMNLSQRELAEKIGVSHTVVNLIESGKNKNAKLSTILLYCECLNITVFDFMGLEESKPMFLKMLHEWVSEGLISEDNAASIYKHTFI